MTGLPNHFALAAILAACLGTVAVWSPRRLAAKLGALALLALFLPAGWLALDDLLSRPKPASLEWARRGAEKATVIASQLREGDGVYLWLQLDGAVEPRAYRLPWDKSLAQDLEKARETAERNGTGVVMQTPFERSYDKREPKFYALPQPAMPEKRQPDQQARMYERPGQDT